MTALAPQGPPVLVLPGHAVLQGDPADVLGDGGPGEGRLEQEQILDLHRPQPGAPAGSVHEPGGAAHHLQPDAQHRVGPAGDAAGAQPDDAGSRAAGPVHGQGRQRLGEAGGHGELAGRDHEAAFDHAGPHVELADPLRWPVGRRQGAAHHLTAQLDRTHLAQGAPEAAEGAAASPHDPDVVEGLDPHHGLPEEQRLIGRCRRVRHAGSRSGA